MGWIDDLLGVEVQDNGVDVGQRKTLNFVGADVSENIAEDRIDIYVNGVGDWKESARLCPVAALPAYTRSDNDILADANGAMPNLDGVAPVVDDVVLLVGAATASDIDNGLWRITSLGSAGSKWAMTRQVLADETGEMTPQTTFRVEEGTVNASRIFHVETTGTIVLNTTPISIVDSVTTTPLVTATVRGVVSPFTATANLIFCSDGATAGGAWRAFLNFGPGAVASAGDIRGDSTFYVYGLNGGAANTKLLYWDGATLEVGDQANATTLLHSALTSQQFNIGATALLALAAGAVTAPGNPTWDLGTNTVDVDILRFGALPPATGAQRWSKGTAIHGLDRADVGTTSLVDWDVTTQDHLTLGANDGDLDGVDIVAGAAGEFDVRIAAANLLKIAAGAISYPSNPTHNTGTGAFTIGGALTKNNASDLFAATTGAPTIGHAQDTVTGGTRPAMTVSAQTSTVAGSTGANLVLAAGTGVAANGNVILRAPSTDVLTVRSSYITMTPWLLEWNVSATPELSQTNDATASVTCDNLRIRAQAASNATGGASAGRSGTTVLEAPTASGHADNLDGNVALVSAHATNLTTLGAEKCCFFGKAVTAPTLPPTNGHILYGDPTTENWMALGEDNTLTTLALK